MALSNPLDVLLAHNHWATRNILDACRGLNSEQLHRVFPMGLGTIHANITHILMAMRVWTDTLAQRPMRPLIEGPDRSVADLLMLLDECAAELDEIVRAHPIDGVVSRTRNNVTNHYTRGGILTHVTTHGMHHRAQCLNMLRQLGVSPLPQSSVVEWMRAVDAIA